MVRKELVAAVIAIMSPMTAQALTLGQVKVGSLLYQPLSAEISVSGTAAELDNLRVGLAPASSFAAQGLTRLPALDDLRFQVVRKGTGEALVIVTSSKSVREPFLDFLVEAQWSAGQAVKEYTLLLDPPFTVERSAPPVEPARQETAPAAEPIPIPAAEPAVAKTPEPAPLAQPEKAPEPETVVEKPVEIPAATSPGQVRVKKGDTLWKVANRVQPSGTTLPQTMNALYQANPNAFLDNNVNLLKSGSILQVPSKEEIAALDPAACQKLLAEHTQAWRAGTPAETTGAQAGAVEPAAETDQVADETAEIAKVEEPASEGQLRLASAGTGANEAAEAESGSKDETSTATGTGEQSSEDSARMADELAIAQEAAESARQESENLKERLDALKQQLDDTRHLLELKDEQLAQLQAYYARESGTPAPDLTAQEEQPGAAGGAAEEEITSSTEGAPSSDVETPPAETVVAQEGIGETARGEDFTAAEASVVTESWQAAEVPAAGEEAGAPETPPVAVEQPEKPTVEQTASPSEPQAVMTTPEQQPAEPTTVAETQGLPLEVRGSDLAQPAAEAPAVSETPASTGYRFPIDVLGYLFGALGLLGLLALVSARRKRRGEMDSGEASRDVSDLAGKTPKPVSEAAKSTEEKIAALDELIGAGYVRAARDAAEDLLKRDPMHVDLNVKLLSIYYKLGDSAAFERLSGQLLTRGFAADHPDLWFEVTALGRDLLPHSALFGAQPPVETSSKSETDELDDMLATLESGLDASDKSMREAAAAELSAAAVDLGSAAAEDTAAPADVDQGLTYTPASVAAEPEQVIEQTEALVFESQPSMPSGEAPQGDTHSSESEVDVKLDLARAFLDLGDNEGARSILEEVLTEGNDRQREAAASLKQAVS